jgi:hypothetical protein
MPRARSPVIVYTLQRLDAFVVQEGHASQLWALLTSDPRDRSVLRVDLAEDLTHLLGCAPLQRRLIAMAQPQQAQASVAKVKTPRSARKTRTATP